jgi:transcriptional regulator with XRE-family HTH domain
MASKKVGTLIKEARTAAGLTQEQLARKISGLSASDISAAERHQKDLTQEQLKKIAKATGVTQASLLNAAKGTTAKKTSSSSKSSMQVTATEKKLVQLYRNADADTKKKVMNLLKENESLAGELLEDLLGSNDLMDTILDTVQDMIGKK